MQIKNEIPKEISNFLSQKTQSISAIYWYLSKCPEIHGLCNFISKGMHLFIFGLLVGRPVGFTKGSPYGHIHICNEFKLVYVSTSLLIQANEADWYESSLEVLWT